MPRAVLLIGAFVLIGCTDKTLHVESDTSWAGTLGVVWPTVDVPATIHGHGNAQYTLGGLGAGEVCWKIAKTTSAGTLRAYADDKTWFGLGSEVDGEATTTAPAGEVTGCTQ